MLKKWEFWFLTVTGAVTLVLVVINCMLFLANRSTQIDINNRQQFIQQSIQLEGLYREIVKALADLSIKNNDKQIKDMLSSQGITVTANPQGAAGGGDAGAPRR
jgi:hypothetical protein